MAEVRQMVGNTRTHYFAHRHVYHRASFPGFALVVEQWKPKPPPPRRALASGDERPADRRAS